MINVKGMPRRRVAAKRRVLPDPIFNSILVTKFINGVMWEGKKSVAERIFYKAMDKIAEKTGEEPLKVFKKAVDNVKPTLEVKSRRIGGATYQVPLEVSQDRRNTLAIRWIVSNARKRSEKTMEDQLVGELLDAINNRGSAIKKKDDVHRMAEANKAFAHYKF
jgi:small subunit ribosomal protein S7